MDASTALYRRVRLPPAQRGRGLPGLLVPVAVLLIGAAYTWFAWRDAVRDDAATLSRALSARADQIETSLKDRIFAYEALLYAGVGLFDASEHVSAQEWRAFALRVRAATLYPGMQGLGFARRTGTDAADRDRTAIVYLEPLNARNRAAIGFDMMSEPTRREAMERARDSGRASLSGKVTLVQEITAAKQAGFLLYMPVYRHGAEPGTPQERREALIGFVYCPFRSADFLNAVIGSLASDVYFELMDAGGEGSEMLFASAADASTAGELTHSRALHLMGRSWQLRVRPLPAFTRAHRSSDAARIVAIGAAGTLLLAGLAWALALSRRRLALQLSAEQLASQRERYSAELLANSLDAYVAIDAADRIIEWNRQAEVLFGWSVRDVHGRRLIDTIVPERFHAAHLKAVRTFDVRTEHPLIGRRIEMPALRRDGSEITVELSILSTTRGGEPLYAASMRDITELKRHEAEIMALNASLEQRVAQRTAELADANRELHLANEQLESFAQNVSHDLRAPLRSIEGFVRMAMDDGAGSAHMSAALAEAARHVRKMQQIIEDLLRLAFIGRQPVQKRIIDIRSMVDAAVADLNTQTPRAEVVIAPEVHEAYADPALLEHALRNLISNALKFSRKAAQPQVEIGLACLHGEAVYYVRDNGVGFRKDQTSELFRAFHRLHDTGQFEGAGVGLTIVKSVIEKHGGRVWAESQPGAGATFFFTLS